jgi:hypothetical protein
VSRHHGYAKLRGTKHEEVRNRQGDKGEAAGEAAMACDWVDMSEVSVVASSRLGVLGGVKGAR